MGNQNNTEQVAYELNHNLALYYQSLLEQSRYIQQEAAKLLESGDIDRDEYNGMLVRASIPATVLQAMQGYIKENRAMIDAKDVPKELADYTTRLESTKREIEGRKVEHLPLTEED